MSSNTISVAVVGATGFAGVELANYLMAHPVFSLDCITSTSEAGTALGSHYESLSGDLAHMVLSTPSDIDFSQFSYVFLAVPHTTSMKIVPELHNVTTIIDLSADYRLSDATAYEQWYNQPHSSPELLSESVYGLVEFFASEMADSRIVACPGCYPTSTALAVGPALQSSAVHAHGPIYIDAKSGISGAGRSATSTTHFCNAHDSVQPYKVGQHQHTPEIEQTLSRLAQEPVSVLFVPHLAPMIRGLLTTCYIPVSEPLDIEHLHAEYSAFYQSSSFVTVLPLGQAPATASVARTNRTQVSLHFDERTNTLVACCAIDNLGKGAATQAIQAANIMAGLDESCGLTASRSVI